MHLWPVHGLAVLAQMAVVVILSSAGFIVLGELRRDEIRFFQTTFKQALFSKPKTVNNADLPL
jgi:hypothetical protein